MKSGLYSRYWSNKDKEVQGVALTLDEVVNEDGTIPTFYCKRAGGSNVDYDKALDVARAPYKSAIAQKKLSMEQSLEILVDAFATTVLVRWENVYGKDGSLLDFTVDNVKQLFRDLPDAFLQLSSKASSVQSFQDEVVEAEVKN